MQSIKNLGLKKPIKVSLRSAQEENEPGYDLVAGQGRIEACLALGFKKSRYCGQYFQGGETPDEFGGKYGAQIPEHHGFDQGDRTAQSSRIQQRAIGKKLDVADSFVGGLIKLMNAGEERVLDAALKNKIPLGVALDIVGTQDIEAQREMLKAYENGELNQAAIRTLKRLIEQRRFLGKKRTRSKDKRGTDHG